MSKMKPQKRRLQQIERWIVSWKLVNYRKIPSCLMMSSWIKTIIQILTSQSMPFILRIYQKIFQERSLKTSSKRCLSRFVTMRASKWLMVSLRSSNVVHPLILISVWNFTNNWSTITSVTNICWTRTMKMWKSNWT